MHKNPWYSKEVFDTPIKVSRAISKSGETPVFLDSTPLFLGEPIDNNIRRSADGLINELVRGELIHLSKNLGAIMRTDSDTARYAARLSAGQLTSSCTSDYIYSKIGSTVPSWVYQAAAEEVDNAMDKVVDMLLNYAPGFESEPVGTLMGMASDGSLRRIQKYCDELGDWYGRM